MNNEIILKEQNGHVCTLTFNRVEKHNAFNEKFLYTLINLLDETKADPDIRVLVLKGNGKHFSAGADLEWMRRMARYTEKENHQDAFILARSMAGLYHFPKPTIAMVHGAAIGGGAGLAACADLVIAAETAHFCFSEVKLGLIPAVISPYVIKAIGERNALALFMTAENFDAHQAKTLQLVHEVVTPETLLPRTAALAQQLAATAPLALKACKALVRQIANHPLDETLMTHTAQVIANTRVSQEGQRGIQAFLSKTPPIWD